MEPTGTYILYACATAERRPRRYGALCGEKYITQKWLVLRIAFFFAFVCSVESLRERLHGHNVLCVVSRLLYLVCGVFFSLSLCAHRHAAHPVAVPMPRPRQRYTPHTHLGSLAMQFLTLSDDCGRMFLPQSWACYEQVRASLRLARTTKIRSSVWFLGFQTHTRSTRRRHVCSIMICSLFLLPNPGNSHNPDVMQHTDR